MTAANVEMSRTSTPGMRLIAAVSLGNGLEMYDFTIYSFFSVYIAATFFPSGDPLTSLLLAVGTFGVGFLFRPIGALVLGRYADRAGRRAAMMLTIWLMAGGTAVIALCPGYSTLGVASPIILVLGRLLQGFSAGGEVGAATSLLLEAGGRRRGFTVSWQLASQGAATLVGAGSGLLLTKLLPTQDLAAWGWRIPFVIGLLIAPVGAFIRRSIPDEHGAAGNEAPPLGVLFSTQRRLMLLAIPVVMGSTVTSYVMVYFMPSFLTFRRSLHQPAIGASTRMITDENTEAAKLVEAGRPATRIRKLGMK
ncbi:MAG: MFS transporter [Alphaproteobacteria bacterium]|nr:MAG: MFS transporter [Alphaproteobacteria bacterium]